MAKSDSNSGEILPDKPIRRFDVFAEYTRLERLDKGDAKDVAKGYGIWLAKVVASRRGQSKDDGGSHSTKKKPSPEPKFRSLNNEEQTDRTFDDIIDRMGNAFYEKVFSPAIEQAKDDGKSYEDIRDSIRKGWKPG